VKPKHVLALTIAVLLSACGPGVGGTGRPAESREFAVQAGAQPAPVCSAAWAGMLNCQPPVINTSAVAIDHPGTTKVQYASDSSGQPEWVLSFEGNKLSLEGGCPRVSYTAEWGQVGGAAPLYFGGYLNAKLIQPVLATGTVKVLPPSNLDSVPGLQLELRGEDGQLLTLLQLQKLSGNTSNPRNCP
jgi:hypothetical protein